MTVTQPVISTERLTVIAEDPDDDRILECAVASRSHVIVSYDHDLLRLGSFRSMPVLRAPDFLTAVDRGTLAPPAAPRRKSRGR